MRVTKKFFDPLYGYLEKGQYVPNDGYGHKLLKAGHVVKDADFGKKRSYKTKVVKDDPKAGDQNELPGTD